MSKNIWLLITIFSITMIHAQNKKDLLYDIENLKSELSEIKSALAEAKKNEKASLAEAEAHKTQALELQKINASLMQNLNSFTEASAQRSDNIGRTLETLKVKETQLKGITDTFSRNDSIALLVLTGLKQTLGEDANIVVENGAVTTLLAPTFLFGSDPASFKIDTNASITLEKISSIIKNNPDMAVTIESHTLDSSNLDLSARRATAVATYLINVQGVLPERITPLGKTGGSNTTYVRIHPKFDAFYFKVREDLKNSK